MQFPACGAEVVVCTGCEGAQGAMAQHLVRCPTLSRPCLARCLEPVGAVRFKDGAIKEGSRGELTGWDWHPGSV